MLFLAVLTALQLLFANAAAAWDDFDFGCANPSLSGLEAVLRYRVFYPTSPSAFDGLRVFETGALRRLEDREAVMGGFAPTDPPSSSSPWNILVDDFFQPKATVLGHI